MRLAYPRVIPVSSICLPPLAWWTTALGLKEGYFGEGSPQVVDTIWAIICLTGDYPMATVVFHSWSDKKTESGWSDSAEASELAACLPPFSTLSSFGAGAFPQDSFSFLSLANSQESLNCMPCL